jgi:NADH-quinone oxidoreductase subunit J
VFAYLACFADFGGILMTLYTFIFYVVSAVMVVATAMAITRRNLVHAVVYLVFSFFGTAMLFYLLGAPLLAALEVIIYAGAIMVLFLFIVVMIRVESSDELLFPVRQWIPAGVFGLIYLIVGFFMTSTSPGTELPLIMFQAPPRELARYVFQHHWLAIEIVSLLLLVALVGALHLGKRRGRNPAEEEL